MDGLTTKLQSTIRGLKEKLSASHRNLVAAEETLESSVEKIISLAGREGSPEANDIQ